MLFPRQAMEGIPFKGQRVAAETKSTELCCPVLPIELYEHTVSFRFLFYLLEVTRLFPPAQIVSTMKVTAFSAVNTPDNVGGSCLKISQMHFKKKKKKNLILLTMVPEEMSARTILLTPCQLHTEMLWCPGRSTAICAPQNCNRKSLLLIRYLVGGN